MQLVQRQSHRNLPLAATGPRPRVDNAADDVIIVDVDDAPIGRHPSSRRIGMDCGTAPYPSSSARAIGESFCIDALPGNTTPADYGPTSVAVIRTPVNTQAMPPFDGSLKRWALAARLLLCSR
jgi:hypothetical protein